MGHYQNNSNLLSTYIYFIILYVWVYFLHLCVSEHYMCPVPTEARRGLQIPGTGVIGHVDSGNQTQVLCKGSSCSKPLSDLSSLTLGALKACC